MAGAPSGLGTAPQEDKGLALPPPDAVAALRVVGTGLPDVVLERSRRTFVLGSDPDDPDVHVRVSSRMLDPTRREHVSRVHLVLQRRGTGLAIRDQGSTNGTYIDDQLVVDERHLEAGDTFRVGDVSLLVMDEPMMMLRPHLRWSLGFTAHAYVDEVLRQIRRGRPILLAGPPGCDQSFIAEQIHATSPRHQRGFAVVTRAFHGRAEQVSTLASASGGTLFIDLHALDTLPAFFAAELFGATYRVRPIIAARDRATAARAFGLNEAVAEKLDVVRIPAVKDRRDDIPRILNALFQRLGKPRDVNELGSERVARLKAFDWPDNLDDLRRNAPRLLALIENGGNKRAAARALGVKHQSLMDALARIGL